LPDHPVKQIDELLPWTWNKARQLAPAAAAWTSAPGKIPKRLRFTPEAYVEPATFVTRKVILLAFLCIIKRRLFRILSHCVCYRIHIDGVLSILILSESVPKSRAILCNI
jgi:hypothetical protein